MSVLVVPSRALEIDTSAGYQIGGTDHNLVRVMRRGIRCQERHKTQHDHNAPRDRVPLLLSLIETPYSFRNSEIAASRHHALLRLNGFVDRMQ